MAVFCWCFFLLLAASNALAVPALPNILSVIQPDSIPTNQDLNSNTSITAATLYDLSSPPANDAIDYRVPNTPITLGFQLKNTPLPQESIVRTILQLQVKLRRFIASHYQVANDVLVPSDDPYMSDPDNVDCFLAVTHWPPERQKRLTYGMVDTVLKGVWEFLYRGGRFVCANFYITDDHLGSVGYGVLMQESPTRDSKGITQR